MSAVRTKLKKLDSEFQTLRSKTMHLNWLSSVWWGDTNNITSYLDPAFESMDLGDEFDNTLTNGIIEFEDWVILDAMYRSRALELPDGGEAMVPAIDIANHDSKPVARFEVEENGDAVLLLQTLSALNEGEEICINYGDHKSSLEFLFTYGFMPMRTEADSESILLSLPSPDDDPLAVPKVKVVSAANCVPGIRISDHGSGIKWDSEALWLMNLNEEDGLAFSISGDSGEQLHLIWKGEGVDLRDLKAILEGDRMWDLFLLRAVVTVLNQVEKQLVYLKSWRETQHNLRTTLALERLHEVKRLSKDYRAIEERILTNALTYFEGEVSWRSFIKCYFRR
jgi:hypothetical protein